MKSKAILEPRDSFQISSVAIRVNKLISYFDNPLTPNYMSPPIFAQQPPQALLMVFLFVQKELKQTGLGEHIHGNLLTYNYFSHNPKFASASSVLGFRK